MKLENDLGKDEIKKLVFSIALPSMMAQFINVLYSIVDRIYVGNIPDIGEIALAGIGICAPIVTLISAFALLIGVGGAPLMTIKLGEKDIEGARKIMANSFIALIVVAILVTGAVFPFRKQILFLFGASTQTYTYAYDYFTICLLGTIFALLSTGMNQFILSQGFAKVGMKAVIIGAVANMILDPIFIFGFGLNVLGAALATVIAQVCSCIYVLRFLLSKQVPVSITFKGYSLQIITRVLKVGLSPFLIVALDNVMLISLNAVIQKYGGPNRGDLLVICTAILQSFMLMITMPLGGITSGTQAILAYNYGARDSKRVLEAEKYIFLMCLGFLSIMFIITHTVSEAFVRIFTNDPEYIQMTVRAIKIYTLGLLGMAVQYTAVDGLTGMGIVKLAMPLSMFRKALFLILVFTIPKYVDVTYIFFAEPISDIVGALVTLFFYLLLIKDILHRRQVSAQ